MMQLTFNKTIEEGFDPFVFISEIDEKECDKAKELAIITDAFFELDLSPPKNNLSKYPPDEPSGSTNNLLCKKLKLDSLITLLHLDDEAKTALQNIFIVSNLPDANDIMVTISKLSVSYSGRIKLFFAASELEKSVTIDSSLSDNFNIAFGFDFKAKSNIFQKKELECSKIK